MKGSSPLYFFLGVIIIIAIGNSFIIFAEPDSKVVYSNWILIINSLIAVGLSVMILIKDKDGGGKRDRANILLALGLAFWFIANIIWAYYELVLDIVSPVPSLADLFLLSAYGFLIYRLTLLYKKIGVTIDSKLLLIIVIGTGLLLIYILNLTLESTTTSNFRGLMLFTVTIAYPILNSVLTVLVLIILLGITNQKHRYIPWICELIGLLAIVIGDSWFAIIILTTYVEQLWMSALLLSAHYLLIAGGLIWYLRYSIKWHSKGIIFKVATKIRNKNKNSKLILLGFVALASSLIITGFYIAIIFRGDGNADFIPNSNSLLSAIAEDDVKKEFVIGAILPFTGSLSSVGKSVKIALEIAENDVNVYYEEMNSSSSFRLLMADSKTSAEDSLVAIKRLHERGANIILGPATSTAVSAVKEYADLNNIVLISYASTSPLLSIEGDNLFRLVPDDTYQGKIIAQRMIDDGIKVIIPFWRGDIYGNALYNSTKSNFEKLGGKVEEGINYQPHTGRFATSLHRINFLMWNQELEKLSAIVSETVRDFGLKSVGVYTISYDEIAPILIQAPLYEILENVRWYGSDSSAQNHHITKNIDSAQFAMKTNFSNPLYSIKNETEKFHELEEELEKQFHEVGSVIYPVIAYDSYWIAALSLDKNSTLNLGKENLTKTFRELVIETAESFEGISGNIELNGAGDRSGGDYDFWIVDKDNATESYEWITRRTT